MAVGDWLKDISRADFLRSVGLYVSRDRLIVARLRKNLLNVCLTHQEQRELPVDEAQQAISELTGWIAEDVREIALKTGSNSRERTLRQAILSLLPNWNPGREPLYICVPQEEAVVLQIHFPQAAEADLQQVIEYEIERQLPFRRDEVFYHYLPMEKKGDKIGVYLFAIPKKNLGTLLDLLGSFGIKPSGVETTVTALANYLVFCAGEAGEPAVVVGGRDHGWEVLGIRSRPNGWKPAHELLFSHWLPGSDWTRGAGREWLQDCLQSSPTLFGWGEVEALLGSVNGQPPPHEDLVAMGNRRLAGGEEVSTPDVIPAIGAALRGVREASFAGNFLQSGDNKRGKALSILNAILVGVLVLGCAGWGASYPIKDELRLRQLQGENKELEPAVEALRREEVQMEKVRKEVSFLASLDRRRGEVLRVLDELSRTVPSSAYFSNLRYRSGVLEVQGNAENASTLIPLLERSPVFENVGFNAPSNRGRDNRETFSLKAELEKSKQKAAKQP